MLESSVVLYWICALNPFTYAVELVRFALYEKINWLALAVVFMCTLVFLAAAVVGYDPQRGLLSRKGAGAAA
jgi:ABC-2 type transport system permease protein